MSTYALIANGVVTEVYAVPAGLTIGECFPAAMNWQPCDPTVQVGWLATQAGAVWNFTAPPPPAAPAAPTVISSYDYLQRFQQAETDAIYTAAYGVQPPTAQSLQLITYLHRVAAAGQVSLTDPTVIAGHQALVSAGLLTAARSAQILTP